MADNSEVKLLLDEMMNNFLEGVKKDEKDDAVTAPETNVISETTTPTTGIWYISVITLMTFYFQ